MAYETLGTYTIWEKTVDEVVDKKLVAGSGGIVTEEVTLMQSGYYAKLEAIIQQETVPAENRSNLKAEMWLHITGLGDYTPNFQVRCGHIGQDSNVNPSNGYPTAIYIKNEDGSYIENYDGTILQEDYKKGATVSRGETTSMLIDTFNTTANIRAKGIGAYDWSGVIGNSKIYHDFDGKFPSQFVFNKEKSEVKYVSTGFRFYGKFVTDTEGFVYTRSDGSVQKTEFTLAGEKPPEDVELKGEGYLTLDNFLNIDRSTVPLTATSFTDEENPLFAYAPVNQYSLIESEYVLDEITSMQAALSFDGETPDIDYRNIPIANTSYTFNLSEAEREALRVKAQGSANVPIYYLIKTTRMTPKFGKEFVSATERILTVVGCQPTLNPTIRDVNSDTIALTGNENIFVKYESMIEFSTGATASKHATIVSQSVQCGSKTVYNLYNGIIDDIDSNSFIFNATDSRGLHADQVVITNTAMIEYVKPTCQQELSIGISGETGAVVTVKLSGNYFNGSFGVADNTLKLEARYKQGSGTMGNWVTLTGTPELNGNTYELTATFSGLSYEQAYTFQCRATDKLNVVETSQYTIRLLPVFDWSETDFHFNVPINIDAESLNMHGETVLRHNETANNTVLSASGGHIYIRPKGTNDTTGETIIYPSGDISFGGTVDLGNSFSINGNKLDDFVIETGSESMGSNGTWFWRKWASGKAECWGCRNFGNMAITTNWGGLFRSEILTQDLPNDVFARTPDSININIVHSNFGGWICKHENTAPSAITTGSFIFVRPASATASPTNIGFYVAGEWK